MPTSKKPLSDRLYAALLRILPFDFRSEFGSDMQEVFHEQRTHQRGGASLLRMWWATIRDIASMAPREHLSVLGQDTRFALRMMRKNPGYTSAAVLILGLGIGANSAIFSVVNSVLLKPLPYAQDSQLVVLKQQALKAGVENLLFSPPEISDYRQNNRSLSALVEYHHMMFTLLGRNSAERVRTGVVSANFFGFFGVKPVLGAAFTPADEKPGAPPVLLVSYQFWKEKLGGDPTIVGQTFQMNDRVHTVIGVLPPIPQYPNENDVYMTTTSCPFRSSPAAVKNRGWRMMSVFGRMKPGMDIDHCRSDLAITGAEMTRDHPETYKAAYGYAIAPAMLRDELTGKARGMLLLLLGTSAFVLLIACANVANLTLARVARREREITIRYALGAGSGRLLRQLLTECFLMALLAAGAGLGMAAAGMKLLAAFIGQFTPRAAEIALDGRVFLFTLACACSTAIVFGSIAALHPQGNTATGIKVNATQTTLSTGRAFVRSTLISAQVAFSCVLLIGAGLMIRSFVQLDRVDPGFARQQVFAAGIDLNWSKYNTAQLIRNVSDRLLAKIQAQPGVLSAAISSSFPLDPDTLTMGGMETGFRIEGRAADPQAKDHLISVAVRMGTPDYFRTLGIPLIRGRFFANADTAETIPVVVLSQSLAHHYWKNADPVGTRVTVDGDHWMMVVGVAGDVKDNGLNLQAPDQIYLPMAQNPSVGSILVRAVGDPDTIALQVRRAIREVDPQTAITHLAGLEEFRADSVSAHRTVARLFGVFSGIALIIAISGLGCMLALAVRERTKEIGIRIALGATPGDVIQNVVGQGAALTIAGIVFGLIGALLLTRFLNAFLFQVSPTDPATLIAVPAALLLAALLAAYFPARRASRIDPQTALRVE